jgi:2-haloacid dehalogenase
MKNIKNIIFDLGGVLIDWNPKYVYREVFETEEKVDWFLENICISEWNIQQDAGRTLAEGTEIKVKEHPEWEKEIRLFYGRWEDMLGEAIEETVAILKYFSEHKNYKIYALTNWSYETFPVALDRFDFLSWFEGILVSGEEKLIKPDPAIYHLMMEKYKLIPEECIFIDDNKENVSGARGVGIHAFNFSSASKLKNDLNSILELEIT